MNRDLRTTLRLLCTASVAVCLLTACGNQEKNESDITPTVAVHTIGDSTMADYAENTTRTRGWGEMLQEFFAPQVEVLNYARGGRSSRSFCEEGLWDKVKQNLHEGDYVLIQFAHNDEKEGGLDGADGRGTAPWTTYKSYLEKYVDESRQAGATPIFVTPIIRRYFDKNEEITPKGCHDLGVQPDDSTLNYVRVMKHVANAKQVPVVDMTAMTKAFAEALGRDATTKQIYVPTDGTHTQATGAACYARLAAEELKRQGFLSDYIRTDIPLVFNPSAIDFDTIFVGDKTFKCLDLVGLNLQPKSGTLTLHAPEGMTLSTELEGEASPVIELTYSDGKLWNQELFLHFAPQQSVAVTTPLLINNNKTFLREIPVTAYGKQVTHRSDTLLTQPTLQLKGIVETPKGYTIESGSWPADIDEDGKRYVEFIIQAGDQALALQQLSFRIEGNVCYRVAYAAGKDFYPRTDIGEIQPGDTMGEERTYPLSLTINPGQRLHIRLFPWNVNGGSMHFRLIDWQLKASVLE